MTVALYVCSVELAALSLPLGQHGCISLLLLLDASAVLELGKHGSTLLVHLFLDDSALFAISLIDLLEDVGLMVLLSQSISLFSILCLSLHASDFLIDDLLLIGDLPLFFACHHLLGTNGLCAVFVNLLHEVDTGLVLLAPFVFFQLPLLLAFEPGQVLNQLLLSFLVFSLLKVELLELNDFITSAKALLHLDALNFLLLVNGFAEHFSVAFLLNAELLLSKDLLSVVVTEELQIALADKDVLLSCNFAFLFVFKLPLLVKHFALEVSKLSLLLFTLNAGVLLPVENCQGVTHSSLLFFLFSAFTLLLGHEV